MRRSSLYHCAPLTDLAALSVAIMASPSIRDLLARHVDITSHVPDVPAGITCGEIIAAIYDLLENTPLAPHAAGIVDAVLALAAFAAPARASRH
ncbi:MULTISPECIES: hypothetical protein [Sphingobium]|jgi:hypothetical protein|uniref:hypothetical protein n=1 Tax=Sphingobium TaxID=165695 RepID=UPI0004E32317|nr:MULTISPECIES: hypothetical protein [Sphingobium]KFD26712.1 hypothetical protein IH86_18915 [Sphingobium yanoikuyae]MDV3481964.1 hypothetical protein [Sphingobium yanoikuyae]HUD91744.1 hypothetical protein [Sphingobium sp.]